MNTQNAAAVWEQMLHIDTGYVNHSQGWSVKICLCECAQDVHVNEAFSARQNTENTPECYFKVGWTLLLSRGFLWWFHHILHFLHMMSKTKPELFLNRAPFLWLRRLIGWVNTHKGHWKSAHAPDCCHACLLYLKWEGLYPERAATLETTWTPHIQLQQGNCVVLHQNKSFIYSS